jgi:hypothetical protein
VWQILKSTQEQDKMDFVAFKDKLLIALSGLLVAVGLSISTTLFSLNEKMAVIVEKVTRHELDIRQIQLDFYKK